MREMRTPAGEGGRAGQLGGGTGAEPTQRPLDLQGLYPDQPGWRSGPNEATSKAAAAIAGNQAGGLKQRILSMLAERPATPEELGQRFAAAGEKVLLNTVRARCSDLHALGRLLPSGTYGVGESGKTRVIRWRVATREELALFQARQAAERSASEDRR